MKHFFIIILGLLIVINIFSQKFIRKYSDIERSPEYLGTTEDYIHHFEVKFGDTFLVKAFNAIENNISNIEIKKMYSSDTATNIINLNNYLNKHTLHFLKNGKLYMLAYEPYDRIKNEYGFLGERNLYLYCRDNSDTANPWRIVSKSIQTGYCKDNDFEYNGQKGYSLDYKEIDFHTKLLKDSYGEVIIEKNITRMKFTVETMKNRKFSKILETINFKEYNNKFYIVE